MDTQLFQHLKWSYNVLSKDLQICFLSLAAYPEDAVIICEELIDMWIAESVVKGSGDIYLHDIGHSYVDHLRNHCLIEVVSMDYLGRIHEYVKIHNILHDLAVHIAAEKEQSYYFKVEQGMINFPLEEDMSKDCAKFSLMRNNLQSLPTTFARSSLSVLLLGENRHIKEIPGSFLNEFPSLRVFNLSYTDIMSLPPSIGNLKHLASLQLLGCNYIRALTEAIGDLKELQFLNLKMCLELRCLPERISELKRLRALNIVGCDNLKHLPLGISEFVLLEILTMEGSSIRLEFHVRIKSPVKEGVMGMWSKMRYLDSMVHMVNIPFRGICGR